MRVFYVLPPKGDGGGAISAAADESKPVFLGCAKSEMQAAPSHTLQPRPHHQQQPQTTTERSRDLGPQRRDSRFSPLFSVTMLARAPASAPSGAAARNARKVRIAWSRPPAMVAAPRALLKKRNGKRPWLSAPSPSPPLSSQRGTSGVARAGRQATHLRRHLDTFRRPADVPAKEATSRVAVALPTRAADAPPTRPRPSLSIPPPMREQACLSPPPPSSPKS